LVIEFERRRKGGMGRWYEDFWVDYFEYIVGEFIEV
jgi:hypothetical protein